MGEVPFETTQYIRGVAWLADTSSAFVSMGILTRPNLIRHAQAHIVPSMIFGQSNQVYNILQLRQLSPQSMQN